MRGSILFIGACAFLAYDLMQPGSHFRSYVEPAAAFVLATLGLH